MRGGSGHGEEVMRSYRGIRRKKRLEKESGVVQT